MTDAIEFDWSENTDENGRSTFDLECPNHEHHRRYGYSWETKYEATEDLEGESCEPYQGCPCCEDDSGYLAPAMNYIYPIEGYDASVADRILVASTLPLVLVQNTSTREWFFALTGGGMDMSSHIVAAYHTIRRPIPYSWLMAVTPDNIRMDLKDRADDVIAAVRERLKTENAKTKSALKQWE